MKFNSFNTILNYENWIYERIIREILQLIEHIDSNMIALYKISVDIIITFLLCIRSNVIDKSYALYM